MRLARTVFLLLHNSFAVFGVDLRMGKLRKYDANGDLQLRFPESLCKRGYDTGSCPYCTIYASVFRIKPARAVAGKFLRLREELAHTSGTELYISN